MKSYIIQNTPVHLCWGNVSNHPWSFSSSSKLYMYHYFNSTMHSLIIAFLQHTVTSFSSVQMLPYLRVVLVFCLSLCKSHLIQMISYTSVTNTDLVFHLFCCASLFPRQSFPSHCSDIFCNISLLSSFITFPTCLFLLQILDTADWVQPTSFATLHVRFSS